MKTLIKAIISIVLLPAAISAAQPGPLEQLLNGVDLPSVPEAKGYIANAYSKPVEWLTMPAGQFHMGTDDPDAAFTSAKPIHRVTLKSFAISKTPVTVGQYTECVLAEACDEPKVAALWLAYGNPEQCNWGKPYRGEFPINCITWYDAVKYAAFKKARLPSESEWEYAATSAGNTSKKYPWGMMEPSDRFTVIGEAGGTGAVCSKPEGKTMHGLCDMAGNVWEWVTDDFDHSYYGVPVTGAPLVGSTTYGGTKEKVLRGGSFASSYANIMLRVDYRYHRQGTDRSPSIGFRIAKDLP